MMGMTGCCAGGRALPGGRGVGCGEGRQREEGTSRSTHLALTTSLLTAPSPRGQWGARAGLQAGACHDENDNHNDRADNSPLLRVFIAPLPRCPSPESWERFTDVT